MYSEDTKLTSSRGQIWWSKGTVFLKLSLWSSVVFTQTRHWWETRTEVIPSIGCRCSCLGGILLPLWTAPASDTHGNWTKWHTHTQWYFASKTSSGSQRGPGPLGCKIRKNAWGQICWLSANCHFSLGFKVLKCCLWRTLCYNQGRNLSLRQATLKASMKKGGYRPGVYLSLAGCLLDLVWII